MDAERIVKLTPDAIRELVEPRGVKTVSKHENGMRREERWPFPGAVEVWLPETCYGERHVLATVHNISPHGLAMQLERPIDKDTKIELAIHEPELSCYGNAFVRHCTRTAAGYLVGVEFSFDSEEEEG
jgi:hypothetical protein